VNGECRRCSSWADVGRGTGAHVFTSALAWRKVLPQRWMNRRPFQWMIVACWECPGHGKVACWCRRRNGFSIACEVRVTGIRVQGIDRVVDGKP